MCSSPHLSGCDFFTNVISILDAIARHLLKMLPRCLVFDLDGCVWDPEMYELWSGGGAPFKENKDGTLSDRAGKRSICVLVLRIRVFLAVPTSFLP